LTDDDIVTQDIKCVVPKTYWTCTGDGVHITKKENPDALSSHLKTLFPSHRNHDELLREVLKLKHHVHSMFRVLARDAAVAVVNQQKLLDEFGKVVVCLNMDDVKKAIFRDPNGTRLWLQPLRGCILSKSFRGSDRRVDLVLELWRT
jgi:hypothetical protein